MHRSRFAVFLGALVSLIAAIASPVVDIGRDFALKILHLDFADHAARLDRDAFTREIDAVPIAARFKAFVSRAFEHDRYSAGRFEQARSTIT